MESLKDLEGISGAYYNEALVCIEEGNFSTAYKHFRRSMEYPIHNKVLRDERSRVFKQRLEENGENFSILFKYHTV
jgi:hypothetical protein